jgi:hypothetical protein
MEEAIGYAPNLYTNISVLGEFALIISWLFIVNLVFVLCYKSDLINEDVLFSIPLYELFFVLALMYLKLLLSDVVEENSLFVIFLFCVPIIPPIFFTVLELCKVLREGFLDKLLRRD